MVKFILINDCPELESMSQYTYFLPWIHARLPGIRSHGLFGPKDRTAVEHRVIRLSNLIKLLGEYSYLPTMDDIVMGYVLKNSDDFRFVLTVGHHRLAVMSAFLKKGFISKRSVLVKSVLVKINNVHSGKRKVYIFDRDNSNNWVGVKSGFVSESSALKLFDSFFCDKPSQLNTKKNESLRKRS